MAARFSVRGSLSGVKYQPYPPSGERVITSLCVLHTYAVFLQVESHVCGAAGAGIPADVSDRIIVHITPSLHLRDMDTNYNV